MMVFLRPVYRHDENGNESFWGYIILAVEQRQVMSTANIPIWASSSWTSASITAMAGKILRIW